MRLYLIEERRDSMSDGFKLLFNSKATTKKEIQDELQRLIRAKIDNVVDTAMSEARESHGEKIPPRDTVYYGRSPQQRIEYTLTEDELAYPPEAPDENAPITEKIRQMRELGQTLYKGYMVRQCAELTLVKQGEFMQDVTDDFARSAFCAIERPVYGALSAEQLRTYFTWRTDARRGTYYKIDKPYVTLYCYELMNKIGVLSSQDAFNRLVGVWENCREFCPSLDKTMPLWLKDFYAFNDIGLDFSELAESFPIKSDSADKITSELMDGDYSNKLEYLASHSSYNLIGSIFYTDDNIFLLNAAAQAALSALERFFLERGISLFELICGRSKKDFGWSPFAGAYVDRERMDGFHACRISSTERYCIKRGQPCFERFESAPFRNFIGYILKATESVLRERTGFRYSIVPNLSVVLDDFFNREKLYKAVSEPEFASIIPDAVNAYCDEHGIFPPRKEPKRKKKPDVGDKPQYQPALTKPQKVEIDLSALETIRREADETTRKLIIEEYEDALPEEQINELTAAVVDEVFEELTEQARNDAGSHYDLSSLSEPWKTFAKALDTRLISVLNALDNGTAEMLCRDIGALPETVYEEINAIALEHIGDVVIESDALVPDYYEDIKNILNITK